MSTDLTTRPSNALGIGEWTEDDVRLIANTICKPKDRHATESELRLLLRQAERTGLDPLAGGQIYAVFRWDKRVGGEKMTVQTGIDGFRLIANRTGEYAGVSREWCGPDGAWRDVWLSDQPPAAARATAHRVVRGQVVAQPQVATMREYNAGGPMWSNKPALMLAKCAEALALRALFPAELSGLYTGDELPGGSGPATDAARIAPPEVEPVRPDYRRLKAASDAAGADGKRMNRLADEHSVPPGDTLKERLRSASADQVASMAAILEGEDLPVPGVVDATVVEGDGFDHAAADAEIAAADPDAAEFAQEPVV